MGGGKTGSSSDSRPLTPAERTALFDAGKQDIAGTLPSMFTNAGVLKGPEYVSPTMKLLSNGDYGRLESKMLQSRTAPLNAALQAAVSDVDNDAAKRGVWSSGLAIQSQHDLVNKFAPELRAAAGEAATARYGAQMDENAMRNSAAMENATRKFNSQWAPANYVKDLYSGTSGSISSGNSSGWNASI